MTLWLFIFDDQKRTVEAPDLGQACDLFRFYYPEVRGFLVKMAP